MSTLFNFYSIIKIKKYIQVFFIQNINRLQMLAECKITEAQTEHKNQEYTHRGDL
jgi:hypothetical protein